MRKLRPIAILTLGLAALVAAGCSSDDNGGAPRTPIVVDVRDGTWLVTSVITFPGPPDSCGGMEAVTEVDTLVICSFILDDELEGYDVSCSGDVDGDDFSFECGGVVQDLNPCALTVTMSGTGSATDTTIEMSADQVLDVTGPGEPCDIYREWLNRTLRERFGHDCARISHMELRYEWLSDEDADLCGGTPEEGEEETPLALKSHLRRLLPAGPGID